MIFLNGLRPIHQARSQAPPSEVLRLKKPKAGADLELRVRKRNQQGRLRRNSQWVKRFRRGR